MQTQHLDELPLPLGELEGGEDADVGGALGEEAEQRGSFRSRPITNWLKRSACQVSASGNSVASVPETPSARRWSPGADATLRTIAPPGSSRERARRKNSRVAR